MTIASSTAPPARASPPIWRVSCPISASWFCKGSDMANLIDVKVPDIGDFADIHVIEILVKTGDTIKKEDSLVSLESDKATMEVPSPDAGGETELKGRDGGNGA